MHDIKYIRNNFSEFKKQVNNRNTEVDLDKKSKDIFLKPLPPLS